MVAPDVTTIGQLTERLIGWLRLLPPEQERMASLMRDLQARFGERTEPVGEAACRKIERTAWAYSRHLELQFDPAGTGTPDVESKGWDDPDPYEVLKCAAGVGQVRRADAGICLIRIDGLEPASLAHPFIMAAFQLARHATGIVLDLRANGGGDPATVALIAGLVLGDQSVQLSEVTYRDRRRQWWTPDLPAGTAIPGEVPVAVLIAGRTFSSGEALAYHLQARQRVTVVGEQTPGAADHVTPVQLAPTVLGLLPEAYVTDSATGSNWEGVGVRPDIPCSADEAVSRAIQHLGRG